MPRKIRLQVNLYLCQAVIFASGLKGGRNGTVLVLVLVVDMMNGPTCGIYIYSTTKLEYRILAVALWC